MNWDEWQPRSEYFKARRLRAYWWARDRHGRLGKHHCTRNGSGRKTAAALRVRGGTGERAAKVRQVRVSVSPGGEVAVL
jgi:hypothetical protein